MKTYAYVRVSSVDQNEDRQLRAMQELHIPEKQIFVDHGFKYSAKSKALGGNPGWYY